MNCVLSSLAVVLLLGTAIADTAAETRQPVEEVPDPAVPLVRLPASFQSFRQNINNNRDPRGFYNLLEAKGPGCVRSIWFLGAEGKRIVICADGAVQVDLPAEKFFGILLGKEPYLIDSMPLISMPNDMVRKDFGGGGEPGFTSYWPIPFQDSCTIRVYETRKGGMAAMVNWQKFPEGTLITPYRLYLSHNELNPAPERGGTMVMADVSGAGFIAGIMQGVVQLKFDDLMYHNGGITWLIDGESDPHAIRGHNMEDDYGFTWGFHPKQTPWFGVPYHTYKRYEGSDPNDGSIFALQQEAVVYRWMGPDPVAFASSMSMRVGTRPDHTETLIWYYKKAGSSARVVETPMEWQVTGTFPCKTMADFDREELPPAEGPWPEQLRVGDRSLEVHTLSSDHAWLNFHRIYFTKPHVAYTEEAAYARSTLESALSREATLCIAFDDWITVWMNGEKLATLRHDDAFRLERIPVRLKRGKNEIVIKSVNFDNMPNNRLWAVSLVIE